MDKTEEVLPKHSKIAKKKLENIIRSCFKENKKLIHDLKEIDYELLLYNLQQNHFSSLLHRLKEVDYANPNILEQLYRYKEKIEEQ